jgi:hypothetical protein
MEYKQQVVGSHAHLLRESTAASCFTCRICCVNRLQQVVGSHDAHLLRLDLFKAQKNLGFW